MTNLKDTIIIYQSKEDDCWIAHSLKTDQIGTGVSVVEAFADALKAVHQVCELAERDSTVEVLRDAPPEVFAMRERAKRLPHEIYEIAHKKVHGEWPDDVQVDISAGDGESFAAEADDALCGV